MAEFEDEIKSSINKLSESISKIKQVADNAARLAASLNTANNTIQQDIQSQLRLIEVNKRNALQEQKNITQSITNQKVLADAAQIQKAASEQLATQKNKQGQSITSELTANSALIEKQRSAMENATGAQLRVQQRYLDGLETTQSRLQAEMQINASEYAELTDDITLQNNKIKEATDAIDGLIEEDAYLEDATRSLTLAQQQLAINLKQQNDPSKKMKELLEGPVAGELLKLANGLKNLVDTIYATQRKFGVSFDTAATLYKDTLLSSVKSFFSATAGKGPFVSQEELLAAGQSFIKQFGTVLTPEEMNRIASEAKRLGVSSEAYVDAKRAFLGTGNEEAVRMRAMSEFAKQGLSAGQAIQFAANNADLLAVAGDKYADSLFRAAAESKKIGINLRDIEKFANSIVGDFEGSLESFAELSALGVELDFNQLAQVAATGTSEEMQNLLQEQLSLAGITGEELQRNRQVRLALTQTTGLDEATILRLAGVAGKPGEETLSEQQLAAAKETNTILGRLLEQFGGLGGIFSKSVSVLTTIATTASIFYQAYLARSLAQMVPGGGIGALGNLGVGAGLIAGFGGGAAVATAMGTTPTTGMFASGIGTTIGAVIGSMIAPGIGTAIGASLGGVAGGAIAGMTAGKAEGGLITGPGTAKSDNILTPTSPGEFVVNAKATQTYGTDFLNKINSGNYTPQQPVVNNNVVVDTDSLKNELRQMVQTIRNMKIEMNGYEVGYVTANEARTPLRTR